MSAARTFSLADLELIDPAQSHAFRDARLDSLIVGRGVNARAVTERGGAGPWRTTADVRESDAGSAQVDLRAVRGTRCEATVSARSCAQRIAAYAVGAVPRLTLVVLRTRFTLLLFRLAVLGTQVITVVAGNAIVVVAVAARAAIRSIADLTVTEDVLVVDAVANAVAGVVGVHVTTRATLVDAHGAGDM